MFPVQPNQQQFSHPFKGGGKKGIPIIDHVKKIFNPNPYPVGPYGGANIDSTLDHIQKTLYMVQQLLPIWKQYAPIVKHAPLIIDMVKLMAEKDDDEVSDSIKEKVGNEQILSKHATTKKETNVKQVDRHGNTLPSPKLFIKDPYERSD
ncbi:VrrA/YqfQ family protein [Halalkalibacillus halophilus]|uniref:VrrA/YqfQ family protein n=1 Tax=Halalkalibacillus halophilus TaxID=392827 RepID=UPI000422358B|nr:VrrA/YqfQ family protein [Halalkalibacillus halophilus]